MRVIDTLDGLRELLGSGKKLHLYGAGFPAVSFLYNLQACGIKADILDILVTDVQGNPRELGGFPVLRCDREALDGSDCILLVVNECFKREIVDYLKDCEAEVADPLPVMFYNDVYQSIKPFVDGFPGNATGLNRPEKGDLGRVAWSCWWQGETEAPDIVKACWKSQRERLPAGVRHIIITRENHGEYLTIPGYILEKFHKGRNPLSQLADYIRSCLLYKYGGVWLDATVLLLETLPEECWELPLYTWRFDKTQFCADAMWAVWFFAARKGSALFRFVMEAFLYYFANYDKARYYFTIDYFVSICINTVDGVSEEIKQIPYNNATAAELIKHLGEEYSEERFRGYCEGSTLQKLTRHGKGYGPDSIYGYIIKTWKDTL